MLLFLVVLAAAVFVPLLAIGRAFRALRPDGNTGRCVRISELLREARTRFESELNTPGLRLLAVFILVLVAMVSGRLLPVVLAVAAGSFLVWFATAWLQEFRFLMPLSDDVFPGRNDKLIWALLLVVLPPVGVWLFRSYRQERWPETKPSEAAAASELG
jgi:hypothetical protein